MGRNTFHVMRHGYSQANEAGLIVSSINNGVAAYGLACSGKREVKLGVSFFKEQLASSAPYVIYSSPFMRAAETASIASRVLGTADVTYDLRLRERDFGRLELTADRNYERVWEADAGNPWHKKWEVESVQEVEERASAMVVDIGTRRSGCNIILVTHGDVAQVLFCWARGIDPRYHREVGPLETSGIRALPVEQAFMDRGIHAR